MIKHNEKPHDSIAQKAVPNAQEAFAPLCPLYKKCGGCQLQNLPYKDQLAYKQSLVKRLLGRFGRVSPILGMQNPTHYRNKVQAAFGQDRHGQLVSGVFQSSSHRIVKVDNCLIEDRLADKIIVAIRHMLKDFKMPPYDEDTGRGFLRHVLVKRGFQSGQVMVVLVTASTRFPLQKHFVTALLKQFPMITTIVLNVNPYRTSLVLGQVEKVLYGNGYIEDTLCGCVFRISAKSFYQINPVQTEVLYSKAIAFAALTPNDTLLDAYCGIGTIGLIASRQAQNVIGVEQNPDAVRDAIFNAKRNQIQNAYFYKADASDFMLEKALQRQHIDVVTMDPPRAGADERFLSSLVKLSPSRVVYISCNPETLARDLTYLTAHGYAVGHIQPVDMFPFTNHVECVVSLAKKG